MTVANKMREITNKVLAEKEAKEMERINELYNTLLSRVEKAARDGLSSVIIKSQGLDNDRIVNKFIADGFKVDTTKMHDNYITW